MKNIAIKYGLIMFTGLTLLFLLMRGLGLQDVYELRGLNGVIHLGLLYLAIRTYRRQNKESAGNYLSGVAVGMYTSVIGVLLFVLFMGFYLGLDTEFMQGIRNEVAIGKYLTPFTTSLFIMMEGIAISLIGSYIVTRIVDIDIAPNREPEAQSFITRNLKS